MRKDTKKTALKKVFKPVIAWLLLTLILVAYSANALIGKDKSFFLPGHSSNGHYQIETACEACHSENFSDRDVLQKKCESCHSAYLKHIDDSHPKAKFKDPRNSALLEIIDARYCVTCHREHTAENTLAMGVTLAGDYCFYCHEKVAEERPTHKNLAFTTCQDSGCHNYHDNSALYEDFLVKHADSKNENKLPVVNDNEKPKLDQQPPKQDSPLPETSIETAINAWATSSHAQNKVNCSACHTNKATGDDGWIEKPNLKACQECHVDQNNRYLQSRHGMRYSVNLEPMNTDLARLPMKADNNRKQLDCHSCHDVHSYQNKRSRTDACLECHNDKHSLAYKDSPHALVSTNSKPEMNPEPVTCARCHFPERDIDNRTLTDHNHSAYVTPVERMIRAVCLDCHSLAFSLDSLADPTLIQTNFSGPPSQHIESIEMALLNKKNKKNKKNKDKDK